MNQQERTPFAGPKTCLRRRTQAGPTLTQRCLGIFPRIPLPMFSRPSTQKLLSCGPCRPVTDLVRSWAESRVTGSRRLQDFQGNPGRPCSVWQGRGPCKRHLTGCCRKRREADTAASTPGARDARNSELTERSCRWRGASPRKRPQGCLQATEEAARTPGGHVLPPDTELQDRGPPAGV